MIASIREAKSRLSELVASAANGEDVIITSRGEPCARIVPIQKGGRRKLNLKRMRALAEQGWTGRKGPDATEIVSDLRAER